MLVWMFSDGKSLIDPMYEENKKVGAKIFHTDPNQKLVECNHPYHGHSNLLTALKKMDANWGYHLSRASLSGEVVELYDGKFCAEKCNIIATLDAEKLLHQFSYQCAVEVCKEVELDPISANSLAVKGLWLKDKATDKELKKAFDDAHHHYYSTPIPVRKAMNKAKQSAEIAAIFCAAPDAASTSWVSWLEENEKYNSLLEKTFLSLLAS